MISVQLRNRHLVVKSTEGTLRQILDGLEEGMGVIGGKLKEHAAANHVAFGPGAARKQNPDGSYRFFSRTGKAQGSIEEMKVERTARSVRGGIMGGSTQANYLVHLEFGTRHAPAFPCFKPAGDAIRPKMSEIMRKALAKHVRGKR